MGKKGKRSGFGGSGGGNSRGGTAPRASSGLVVVNPMLLQSMASKSHSAGPAKTKPPPNTKSKPQKNKSGGQQKRKQREVSESEEEEKPVTKKPHHEHGASKKHRSKASLDEAADIAPLFQLQLAREDHGLAGLYWVLLTRELKRSAVVAIPNAHATFTPPLVAHALKSLGFQALSLHSKMTHGQRKQNVERLVQQSLVGDDKFVLVVNDHWLSSAACGSADLIALGSAFVGKSAVDTKFARVVVVHADVTVPARAEPYDKPLGNAALQQLQARLKLATQIATTLQKLQSSSSGSSANDGPEAKWASKFAKGADLSDDDDEDKKSKKKKNSPLNPDEQRLRALTEKLLVLLARSIDDATPGSAQAKGGATAAGSVDTQNRAEKLTALGMVVMTAAMGTSVGDGERLSAQTQWLDSAPGSRFGGDWEGAVRHGASKDATSLVVRRRVCECLNTPPKTLTATNHLRQWRPNQQPADVDAWGGAYGKVCGHNEVVMQHVRPFFPQEVLNSRVCSKRQPAPGNQGFDGCLEFLRLACLDGQRCMTVWDAEQFVFISKTGRVSCVNKLQFLTLPLAGLQTLMANMRQWTLACEGRRGPVLLLEGIRLCCRLGSEDVASSRLPDVKLVRRVLAFAIGGSTRVWKQISKMPTPIASEVVYEAK